MITASDCCGLGNASFEDHTASIAFIGNSSPVTVSEFAMNRLSKTVFPLLLAAYLMGGAAAWAQAAAKFRVSVAELSVSDSIPLASRQLLVNSGLIDSIENAIRNGRKFELLTRRADALAEIRKEQQFAKSGLAAGDAALEGQLSNAQAVVKVKVESFRYGRSATKIPNLDGKYRVSDSASLSLNVQILDTTKGTVTGAFPVKAVSSTGTSIQNGVGSASRIVLEKAIEEAAGNLANQLSDTIFPVTVLQVKGKRLWVNRGNDSGMKAGETFIVYEPGEDLIDPQTGENLGTAETEVGLAKVLRINPKVTVMEVTKGDPAAMAPGFILRRTVK